MDNSLDQVLDRKRLRRKLTIWRIVAFLGITIAIIVGLASAAGLEGFDKQSPHIARIPITGFISSSRYAMKQLEKIRKDDNVKAVIISVDSPGGTTVGGEQLHNALRAIGKEKPVVTSIGGLAASAGYMVAVASDHIVAPRTSIVGSIGVLFQYPDASKLLGNIGVSMEEIKSSPLKAEPSPFNETPPEARAMLRTMLLDTYDWFAGLVKQRRGFSDSDAEGLLDGSVFTGKQALDNKLIDALGDEATAKSWLVQEKNVSKDLEIVSWSLKRDPQDLLVARALVHQVLSVVGLEKLISLDNQSIAISGNSGLDGFLSVWHPASSNGAITE